MKGLQIVLLKKDEKVYLIVRRLFEQDARRHFIGKVTDATDSAIRATGYVFAITLDGEWKRKDTERTCVFPINQTNVLVFLLPENADTAIAKHSFKDNRTVVTDGSTFELDIEDYRTREWRKPSFDPNL